MSLRRTSLIVLVVGVLLFAASAQATTFRIGSDLSSPPNAYNSKCAPCTEGVNAVPSGPVTAPCTGTITSWAIRAYSTAPGGSDVKLRVLHPDGTGAYSGAGTSPAIHLDSTHGVRSGATSLPITAGDGIGVDATNQTLDLNISFMNNGETYWTPPLPDGGAAQDPTSTTTPEVLVQATISCPPWTLSVSKTGSGSGIVTSADGTINCGSTCTHPGYAENTLVTLTAAPSAGSTFTGWSGACGGTGSCVVTMNNDQAVSASFAAQLVLQAPLTAAQVSGSSESNSVFSVSSRPKLVTTARKHRAVGTTFRYTLDKSAAVRFDFTQPGRGRKVNGKCVAQNKHNKRKRKCTRTLIRGSLTFAGHPGRNTVNFFGWLSKHKKLKPGKYTVIITATTPGVGSTSQTLKFTIVK